MPAIVEVTGSKRIGNSRNTPENTAGISVPPAKPCSTRKPTSVRKFPLKAQPIEARVKMLIAITNSHRSVSTRVSHPVNGIAMISAIRYAVWIQLISSGEIASASWIVGSEVATTWMSRIAMNMPRHIRTKPIQVAILVLLVRQIILVRAALVHAGYAGRDVLCRSQGERPEMNSIKGVLGV